MAKTIARKKLNGKLIAKKTVNSPKTGFKPGKEMKYGGKKC